VRLRIRIPQVLVIIGLLAFAAVGLAVLAQYAFDMQPCPWCVFQRLVYLVVGVLALLAAALPGLARRAVVGLAVLGSLGGIAAALWQQLHAVNESSCDLSLAERVVARLQLDSLLPQLFEARTSCADAAVSVLGVPFAVWSCAMFALLALLLAWTFRATARAARSAF